MRKRKPARLLNSRVLSTALTPNDAAWLDGLSRRSALSTCALLREIVKGFINNTEPRALKKELEER